jgi:hypothetical protein
MDTNESTNNMVTENDDIAQNGDGNEYFGGDGTGTVVAGDEEEDQA